MKKRKFNVREMNKEILLDKTDVLYILNALMSFIFFKIEDYCLRNSEFSYFRKLSPLT